MPLDKSAALEPVHQKTGSTIRTGKLVVNLDTRVVSVDDLPVRLTGMEYGILELLSLRISAPEHRSSILRDDPKNDRKDKSNCSKAEYVVREPSLAHLVL
jgi:DNA-binding response OmpR family regulator